MLINNFLPVEDFFLKNFLSLTGSFLYNNKMEKHRSKFEDSIAKLYPSLVYECIKLNYTIPSTKHLYIPDFKLVTKSNKVIWIEAKGLFKTVDRKKMLLVKEQYPDLDIRFIFQNPNIKISKTSQTTAAEWCIKHGFKYGNIKTIEKWLTE